MKYTLFKFFILISAVSSAQIPVDLSAHDKRSGTTAGITGGVLNVGWSTGKDEKGSVAINLDKERPLFGSMRLIRKGVSHEVASTLDPAFILTVGKRDLTKPSGWNIFFDKTAYLPYEAYRVAIDKRAVKVSSVGSRTIIAVSDASAGPFSGTIEITLYNGSPLVNIAAVMSTQQDSTAIIYDAGFVTKEATFEEMFWSDTEGYLQSSLVDDETSSRNLAVKYRAIIGETEGGSVAVFPPPHQYFYPLDNAYNLKYTWYGRNYRELIGEFGIGIRQDLMGDRRHVPWFNAPPDTRQRLNFFCLLSSDKDGQVIEELKRFTHDDSYKPLSGYKTMSSHFHTEHIDDVLTHKPLPEIPGHVKALRNLGVNIMHLGNSILLETREIRVPEGYRNSRRCLTNARVCPPAIS